MDANTSSGPPARTPAKKSPEDWGNIAKVMTQKFLQRLGMQIPEEDPKARQQLSVAFPHGYQTMPTPGDQLLCGLWALSKSIGAQLKMAPPGLLALQAISQSPEFRRFEGQLGEHGRTNVNNFYIDQLAAILELWGAQRGLDLQLGYVLADGRPFLVPSATSDATRVVWISSSSKTGTGGDAYDHYEGLSANDVDGTQQGKKDMSPSGNVGSSSSMNVNSGTKPVIAEALTTASSTAAAMPMALPSDPAPQPGAASKKRELPIDSSSAPSASQGRQKRHKVADLNCNGLDLAYHKSMSPEKRAVLEPGEQRMLTLMEKWPNSMALYVSYALRHGPKSNDPDHLLIFFEELERSVHTVKGAQHTASRTARAAAIAVKKWKTGHSNWRVARDFGDDNKVPYIPDSRRLQALRFVNPKVPGFSPAIRTVFQNADLEWYLDGGEPSSFWEDAQLDDDTWRQENMEGSKSQRANPQKAGAIPSREDVVKMINLLSIVSSIREKRMADARQKRLVEQKAAADAIHQLGSQRIDAPQAAPQPNTAPQTTTQQIPEANAQQTITQQIPEATTPQTTTQQIPEATTPQTITQQIPEATTQQIPEATAQQTITQQIPEATAHQSLHQSVPHTSPKPLRQLTSRKTVPRETIPPQTVPQHTTLSRTTSQMVRPRAIKPIRKVTTPKVATSQTFSPAPPAATKAPSKVVTLKAPKGMLFAFSRVTSTNDQVVRMNSPPPRIYLRSGRPKHEDPRWSVRRRRSLLELAHDEIRTGLKRNDKISDRNFEILDGRTAEMTARLNTTEDNIQILDNKVAGILAVLELSRQEVDYLRDHWFQVAVEAANEYPDIFDGYSQMETHFDELQEEHATLIADIARFKADHKAELEKKTTDLDAKLAALNESELAVQNKLQEIDSKKAELSGMEAAIQTKLDEMDAKKTELSGMEAAIQTKLHEMDAKLAKLENRSESEAAHRRHVDTAVANLRQALMNLANAFNYDEEDIFVN